VDIWGAILVLARRFYLTVPLAAASLIAAYVLTHSIAPEYHASASVVLIGPTAIEDKANPAPVNPYAQLGTTTMAATIQLDLSNDSSVAQVLAAHNSTNYSATAVSRTPIITLTATSADPRQAVSTANQLISILRQNLASRQQPFTTKPTEQITAQVLSAAELATADTSSRTKAEAISMGTAIVLTIIVVLIVDAVLASRRRRHRGGTGLSAGIDGAPAPQQRTTVVRS